MHDVASQVRPMQHETRALRCLLSLKSDAVESSATICEMEQSNS